MGGAQSSHHSTCAVLATFTPSGSVGGMCFGPGCGGGIGRGDGGPESTTVCVGSIPPATAQVTMCLPSPTRGRLTEWVAGVAGIGTAVSYAPYTGGGMCHVSRRDEGPWLPNLGLDCQMPPSRRGGPVTIPPTHPLMDPMMPAGDGVRSQASLLQISPLDSVYGEGCGTWSRSQSHSQSSSSSVSDQSDSRSRSRSRSWERAWDSRPLGVSSSFGEAVKSLLASGTTASGSRIDPLVHPEEGAGGIWALSFQLDTSPSQSGIAS